MELSLFEATIQNRIDIVTKLLDGNANIETTDDENNTLLHYASRHGHIDIVIELLNRNANIEAKDKDNDTNK